MCYDVLHACMSVCQIHLNYRCKHPCVCWDLNLNPPEEQDHVLNY